MADDVGAGEGVADTAIEEDGRLGILRAENRSLFTVRSDGAFHQQIGVAWRVCPGHRCAADCDLLLNQCTCVLVHAGVTASGEFGQHSGLARAGTSGDDIEGWEMDLAQNNARLALKDRDWDQCGEIRDSIAVG